MYIDLVIKNYRCFSIENPAKVRINNGFTSFVGINNVGKSALLKFFYELRPVFSGLASERLVSYTGYPYYGPPTIKDYSDIFNNRNEHNIIIEIYFEAPITRIGEGNYKLMLEVTMFRTRREWQLKFLDAEKRTEILNAQIKDGTLQASNYEANVKELIQLFKNLGDSIYIGPFRNAILVGSSSSYYDIQIGKDFIELWNEKKTGDIKRDSKLIHELEQDIQRIFGYKELSINANSKKNSLQLLIDGNFYDLTEVGSGLSQLIIIMANILVKNSPFIFIDEPESNLHPSLQIDFLTTLGAYSKEGVFFATHNIGLARAISNQIYSLTKSENGNSIVRELEGTPRLAEFLGELSFSGYKELGFDEILLVEGRTEIKIFMQFLRIYDLDHKVVILPLGGNDLISSNSEQELLELTRISTTSHLKNRI